MEGGDSSDAPPAHRAGEAEVERPRKDGGVLLLADESFDFDLSLSSLSANEDDEVFFGPVGHRERCIAARLEGDTPSPEAGRVRWSPLTGEKFVEVYKEAHLLAFQIESSSRSQAAHAAGPEGGERFIQDSRLKMSLFEKENESRKSPGSLKRETYCLLEGPLSGPKLSGVQPASGVEPALGVGPRSTAAQAQLTRTRGPLPPPRPSLPLDPSPVRPLSQAATQKRVVSRLPPPRASVRGKSVHLAVEKSKKETPASPSRAKTPAVKESQGDRPLDTPSAAQDVTGVPARGGPLGLGKRALSVPSKVGLKRTALKPPGCAAGLARKPGAPGGFSGRSSRACPSPVGSTGTSGGRRSVSAEGSRPPSDPGQPGPAGAAAAPPSLQARPAAVCGQSWCPGRPAAPTTSAPPQPQTPEERRGARLSSQPRLPGSARRSVAGGARRESSLHSGTKAVPAPASPFKVPKFPAGGPPDSATPRLSRAPRPQSCTSTGRAVHGTPARRASGPVSRTPVSAPRVAALLTPAGRRLSGLPVLTPRTQPRTLASPQRGSARRLSSEPRRRSAGRPAPGNQCSDESSDGSFSPLAAVPQALSFSPEKSDFALPTSVAAAQAPDQAQPPADAAPAEVLLVDIPLERLCIAPASRSSPPADVALIDFRSPPGAGGPLIDLLVNTPDPDRSAVAKLLPHVGQLVDPCAPLIQLSPEADKENVDSPLLKF
ncbi:G2 and S-phase expressed 1 [Phyllostomus discolor]|uniref:G2 and S-phase expressed 1 n=1 Tax=Phyllostomus discolor TaxID=89673 RepID=A0A834AUL0_9CHIR|nr:G2 and S-phase expressed 1 [Phyllostomus discolor]